VFEFIISILMFFFHLYFVIIKIKNLMNCNINVNLVKINLSYDTKINSLKYKLYDLIFKSYSYMYKINKFYINMIKKFDKTRLYHI
jgi:hypothetical protein